MEPDIEKEIIKETQLSFSKKIENLVWDQDITYFDAINALMKSMDLEPEYVSRLLSPDIKSKLTVEVEELKLIKPSGKDRIF